MSEWTTDVDRRIYKGIAVGMDRSFIQPGDPIVIVTGWKPGAGSTNTMRIINAIDPRGSDLLQPITGISSVPSFNRMNSAGSGASIPSLGKITDEEGNDIKFF